LVDSQKGNSRASLPARGLAFALLIVPVVLACKQMSSSTPPSEAGNAVEETTGGVVPLEARDLEAFFDGVLSIQMERSDIAGASVLVMRSGEVLLQKGYGYADTKAKKPVDPASTVFRLGSISKLFTWISVMQLEEQGKLDIDADVNRYLDFPIPVALRATTLRDLMTHRGGFEDTRKDLIVTMSTSSVALRTFLVDNQPERLFSPGTVPAYSNYGAGLASYVVERVSGVPFEQYVQEHVFTQLGMAHSTFQQPLPANFAGVPSQGYGADTRKPVGFEVFLPSGAGGASSTAADMARFASALLRGGALDGNRILRSQTIDVMWTPQYRASDELPALCIGFFEMWRNNLRWVGHDGGLIAFNSVFFVEPREKLALFVSYNSAGGGGRPLREVIARFSDRYVPAHRESDFVPRPWGELKAVEGTYQSTRRADSTKLKMRNLFRQRDARVDHNGTLHVDGYENLRGLPVAWKTVGRNLWREIDGQAKLFAVTDAGGMVVRIADDFPAEQLERVPWYENAHWVLPAVTSSLAGLALLPLSLPVGAGRRASPRTPIDAAAGSARLWPSRLMTCAALGWVLSVGGMLLYFWVTVDAPLLPTDAWVAYFELVNGVTILAMSLSLLAVVWGMRLWRRHELSRLAKVRFSLVTAACLFLTWFSLHWHVLGSARACDETLPARRSFAAVQKPGIQLVLASGPLAIATAVM
jgi:CubicO group peptidase (beta-lactamase class C family)